MTTMIPRRTALGAAAGAAGIGLLASGSATAAAARPATIPAVGSWRPARGSFTLPDRVVVVVRPGDERAHPEAQRLARDLSLLTRRPARVEVRAAGARHGEVHVRHRAAPQLGREGYRLSIGPAVVVTAATRAGAYYGGRTLLQLLRQSPGRRLAAGVAVDVPAYAERGLMIDIGRKHYPEGYLADRIRDLGWLKLNRLHLHISDDQGFRVECRDTPDVHSAQHLSQAAVRRLVALAARHHVTIVPELDMPGHMTAALRHHPQLQLRDPSGTPAASCLDYTLPEARRFATGLLTEFLALFPGPSFHLGADEFLPGPQQAAYPQLLSYAIARHGPNANAKDGFLDFVNTNAALVRRHGKRPRAWNDGIGDGAVVRLARDVDVEWWTDISPIGDATGIPTPQQVLDAGHRLLNCSFLPTYYVNTSRPVPGRPRLDDFYESWRVPRFHGAAYLDEQLGTPGFQVAAHAPGLLGAKLHLWNDEPGLATPAEDLVGIAPRLRIVAQQTWGSRRVEPTYAEFARLTREVGGPPG